ncbi:DUF2169 family type VI secretion system accessory protein [Neptunomonas phycophila]|uniref:DUF2169 family type VI secretion system accessory protein n=1 Tax=Neptunomonas phycophila TaxID=1572645 RepID=UPI0009488E91|nr:DUF2169 domain-containing protein [Neptunomonas phycophila]
MELNNFTQLNAQYSSGLMPDGRSCVVIVAKGSWAFPQCSGGEAILLDPESSLDIITADVSLGQPGFTPILYENDFARFKPQCDVIMHAHAYSLSNKPEVEVGLKVGSELDKRFRVYGPRQWIKSGWSLSLSKALPFEKQIIHYGLAYGGVDYSEFDSKGIAHTFVNNPLGIGYAPKTNANDLDGKPAPQLEPLNQKITRFNQEIEPVSFGPVSRNFKDRLALAGTYDEHWEREVSPFLPDDFKEAFYQCAPIDQRISHLCGGEEITLSNVMPEGEFSFVVPDTHIYVSAIKSGGNEQLLDVRADTLIIEPELRRFSVVWRASIPIEYYSTEINTIIVGQPTKAWRLARAKGKEFKVLNGGIR